MTAADLAFVAARQAIAKAKSDGTRGLDLSGSPFNALKRLPPELANLKRLENLYLSNSSVSDLSPLTKMVWLTRLHIDNTLVTDLAPISGLVALNTLNLENTSIVDLTPLSRLPYLTTLNFNRTKVSDLEPLVTREGKAALTWLSFDSTPVSDLRPLLKLIEPVNGTKTPWISLRNTFAARNAEVGQIAAMEEGTARALRLFILLRDGLTVPGSFSSAVPLRKPAPLEIEVSDTKILRAGSDGLPRVDANTRAAMGWEALREYRIDFAATFNVGNYAPLPAYLAAFDRAMGDSYDPARVVRIGVQTQRMVALSQDKGFSDNLPDAAASDLRMLAAEMLVFLNRFPDWVAYRDDGEDFGILHQPADSNDFDAIQKVFAETPEVDRDIVVEYAAEIVEATDGATKEQGSKALVSSTREIGRSLAEYTRKQQKTHNGLADAGDDFIKKTVLGPAGVPHAVARKLEKPMRSLANRYPASLGWLKHWYDNTFGPEDEDSRG